MRQAKFILNDGIKGYGVIRQCQTGYKIGPLFADSKDIAEKLITALCATVKSGELIYIDIPEPNTAAPTLIQSLSLTPVFETARMYNHAIPELPLNNIFGNTTFEVG